MPRYALFLRGVNVGGRNKVAMADLRALLGRDGCTEITTLLQSGNAVFTRAASPAPALERQFAKAIAAATRVECECLVRTAKEWAAAIDANPFPAEAKRDPAHLLIVVLQAAPAADGVKVLRAAIRGSEVVEASGKHLYAVYPAGIGNSKLTLPLIEKHLGTRGTGRNWNTVLKVSELLGR